MESGRVGPPSDLTFSTPEPCREQITALQQSVKACVKCKFGDDKAVLFGHGNLSARLMMVGEAPSIEAEDSPDRRVFGRYSKAAYEQFLDVLGEDWDTVWTTNIVKCSLPHLAVGTFGNCDDFFRREVEIINPQYIILFGSKVCEWVLGEKRPHRPLTADLVSKDGRQFITMYHPMHVYRNPQFKTQWVVLAHKVKRIVSTRRIEDFG